MLFGEPQVQLVVTGLGHLERAVERSDLRRQTLPRRQRGQQPEALAGARLDKREAQQQVELAFGLVVADRRPQSRGVTTRLAPQVRHTLLLHQLVDLLEVAQLLAREPRETGGEFTVLGIGEHQRERRRGGLLLAVGVVGEQFRPTPRRLGDPCGWRRRAQRGKVHRPARSDAAHHLEAARCAALCFGAVRSLLLK